MAGGGFKHTLVVALITDVRAHFRRLGDNEEATARTFEAYCSPLMVSPDNITSELSIHLKKILCLILAGHMAVICA